jgi:hypothetical protein
VEIETQVINEGRRFATASAVLRSDGRPLLSVLGTVGDLSDKGDDLLVDGAPPELPPVDQCVFIEATDTFPPPFMSKVELYVHPQDMGFAGHITSGIPRVTGWFRLPDDEPVDTVGLLCALDAFPPTIFNADLPVAWTPTVELTTHIRARPAPGWLRSPSRPRHPDLSPGAPRRTEVGIPFGADQPRQRVKVSFRMRASHSASSMSNAAT